METQYVETRQFPEELVLVPKAAARGARKAAAAARDGGGDGAAAEEGAPLHASAAVWLLGMMYDAARKRSALAIVDGETMERVATLWMKHASPHGLHGSWCPPVS